MPFFFVVPYLLRACFWHAARFFFDFFLQAFSALASFCARVKVFVVTVFVPAGNTNGVIATSGTLGIASAVNAVVRVAPVVVNVVSWP